MGERPVSTEEKKLWLRRVREGRNELQALEEAYREKFDRATSVTAGYAGAVVSGSGDVHKLDALPMETELIALRLDSLRRVRNEVLHAIGTLESPQQRALMIQRYVNCRDWSEIAERMSYSERNLYRLHGEALKRIRISRSAYEKAFRRGGGKAGNALRR